MTVVNISPQATCKVKECVVHTPVNHRGCVTSGKTACKDFICKKEHWTKEDCSLLVSILDQYLLRLYK